MVQQAPEPPCQRQQQQEQIIQYLQQAPECPVQHHQQYQEVVPQLLQQPAESVDTQQQIQIVIANPNSENGALASSTPKLNEAVNLNLVDEDVSNEITVKNENADDSLDADIARLANIN